MVKRIRRFLRDESGAAMIELTISAVLLLTLVLGFVDFGYAYYQWNAANKAVQVGARLASISDPIPLHLVDETGTAPSIADVGEPVPAYSVDPANSYDYVCTANASGTASCVCNATTLDACDGTPVQAAFDLIFDGDGGRPGMKDFFPALEPDEVQIEYIATGLGYWTRPGGPVPTIRVSLVDVPFRFFFLSGLLGFANITMPNMLSTVTGEDLCSHDTC